MAHPVSNSFNNRGNARSIEVEEAQDEAEQLGTENLRLREDVEHWKSEAKRWQEAHYWEEQKEITNANLEPYKAKSLPLIQVS
jgi:hypothetical protein